MATRHRKFLGSYCLAGIVDFCLLYDGNSGYVFSFAFPSIQPPDPPAIWPEICGFYGRPWGLLQLECKETERVNIQLPTSRTGFLSPQQDNGFERQVFSGKKKGFPELLKLPLKNIKSQA